MPHLGDEFRSPLRVAAVAGGDRRALPGEARADGRADAARPAGDQGDAAGQLLAAGHASARTRAMTVSGTACSGTAANARSDSPSGPAAGPIVTTRVPPPLGARVVGRRRRQRRGGARDPPGCRYVQREPADRAERGVDEHGIQGTGLISGLRRVIVTVTTRPPRPARRFRD